MPDINYFAQLNYRGQKSRFGIKTDDRRRHMYVIGKTGMGKSEMLKTMAIQDILNGNGVGIVDPHGELAEAVLDFIPQDRVNDVVYFNPADYEYPMGFNVLENVNFDQRHLVASGLMGVFKKLWPDVWSARMEYILNNAILALLEYPDATMLGINRMFSNPSFRKRVIDHISDPVVKTFWVDEYSKYTQRLESEATASIQNKVGQFVSAPLIRNIIGQVKSTVDIRSVMDDRKIFIANLSKGRIGEDNGRLLGSMLMTKVYLAAMSRVDIPEEQREDFFFYVDEFQNFQSKAFADVLSEARKYHLSLILAHQYVTQMEEEVSDAVFGNVGTIVAFRVGAIDGELLEKEFSPDFLVEDFVNLGKYNVILKLMIDGLASRGFSAATLPPLEFAEASRRDEVVTFSRAHFTNPRAEVEKYITSWHEDIAGMDSKSASRDDGPSRARSAESGSLREGNIELFDAVCDNCGKPTKIPFQPDGKRPVYCKKCRQKLIAGRNVAKSASAQDFDLAKSKMSETNPPIYVQLSAAELTGNKKEPDLEAVRDLLREFREDTTEEIAEDSPMEEGISGGETTEIEPEDGTIKPEEEADAQSADDDEEDYPAEEDE
ncbi:MAG: type IV secretion system DNA-binding domain-containing protein [Candidatus Spechtbacteria bacterium]|nr:type IV secretion system DNA-binding domain-containing protein [Candidatus Spechtbacteria bacterium]